MTVLIKQATIISENSALNKKTMDILIEGSLITEIKKSIPAKSGMKVIEAERLYVSAGWIDLQAVACDPGFEYKEDLDTLVKCAASGGFTAVCVHSSTQPALHNKAQIEYLVNKSRNKVVDILPVGTVTVDGKGKDLAELFDMKSSGAVAFSDYKLPLKDAGTVMRALQYALNIDSLIIAHCNDESISKGGQMNEGETAVTLGLKGIPALAEELMLERNLSVLEYTGGRLHIPTVSTKGSVELVKKAKSSGLAVTCGVAAANLLLDDSSLKDFDTNYKIDPPLRTKRDVQALRNALENGTIDVVVSDHRPQDVESKELEFDLADAGIINLQTAFNCLAESVKNVEVLVKSLADNPRQILGLGPAGIAEKQTANLTLFTLDEDSTLNEKNNHSKSRNSPFLNRPMKGRVVGIINGGKSYFN